MAETPPAGRRTRTVLAGVIGNVLEWYDFGLFGYFAATIGALYFPSSDPLASLLQAYGVFALGFLMRPVGGLIFGHIGDRIGRKRALELSVLLMAVPTTLMAVLPTHNQIGLTASLLLTLIRILQGISVGGEFIGSLAYVGEQTGGRRGFLGCWVTASAGFGILLGSGTAALVEALLTPEQLVAWGWRVPFLAGILVGAVGLWMRVGLPESPRFAEAVRAGAVSRAPILEALRDQWRPILRTVGLAMSMAVGFYVPFVWVPVWLENINEPRLDSALLANTLAMGLALTLNPVGGLLSDRFGRRPVLLACAAGYVLVSVPVFLLLRQGTFAHALGGLAVFGVLNGLFCGAAPAAFVELFPTRTRYCGMAIGYNLTQAVFGGTSPAAATWLLGQFGTSLAPAAYLVVTAAVGVLAALGLRDRYNQPLD